MNDKESTWNEIKIGLLDFYLTYQIVLKIFFAIAVILFAVWSGS